MIESVEVMGKKLLIWEKVDNKFYRACLAEFLASHLLMILCIGSAMSTLGLPNPNINMVCASFGFGVLCLAQIFGPLSGAHINCAVSLGLFTAGRTSLLRTVCFFISQSLGAIAGALFLWGIFGNDWPAATSFGSNSWDPSLFNGGQVWLAELIATAVLMFSVLATIDIPAEGAGPLGMLPISMSVMVACLFLVPIDGCSINPTRSFGSFVVAKWAGVTGNYENQQAVFWFGPLCGAVLAAWAYEYGLPFKPENFAGAKDMDTAIFQANKKRVKKSKKGKSDIDAAKKEMMKQTPGMSFADDFSYMSEATIPPVMPASVQNKMSKPVSPRHVQLDEFDDDL